MTFYSTAPTELLHLIEDYRLEMEHWAKFERSVLIIAKNFPKQASWRIPNAMGFMKGMTSKHMEFAVSHGAFWSDPNYPRSWGPDLSRS